MFEKLDAVHIVLAVLLVLLLIKTYKSEHMMGQAQNSTVSVASGAISSGGVRYLDPASVPNPVWQKTGVSVGAEADSRGISGNTTFGAHDAYYLGGLPYLPQYAP
jgi:hypothetical protein